MATQSLNSPVAPQPPPQIPPTFEASERDSLLPKSTTSKTTRGTSRKSAFFKPNPYWIVPFWLIASFSRGMTLAPRIEVYTSLACEAYRHESRAHRHPHSATVFDPISSPRYQHNFADIPVVLPQFHYPNHTRVHFPDGEDGTMTRLPKKACYTDPMVQKYAAELQTVVILVMGVLSALTTGWWGAVSDRVGRTKVLALAQIGYLSTDAMFIVVARNAKLLVPYGGHRLLILGPVIEGLLGGFTTVNAAVNSYMSDVTPHGSRSKSFSTMQGIIFVGVAGGPALSSMLLTWQPDILIVFFVSVVISLVNAAYAWLIMPESLTAIIRQQQESKREKDKIDRLARRAGRTWWGRLLATVTDFFAPAAVFLPRGNDWRQTFTAIAYFTIYMCAGLYPLKLLYAEHLFGWTAVEMGNYLTIIGSVRALWLLAALPTIIKIFKPSHIVTELTPAAVVTARPGPPVGDSAAGHKRPSSLKSLLPSIQNPSAGPSQAMLPNTTVQKPHHLDPNVMADMKFDLFLARLSLIVDALSYVLVVIVGGSSEKAFVLVTLLAALGGGSAPIVQSVSLCLLPNPSHDAGKLFGALSMLQAGAATILSPLVFGLMYSRTVKDFPAAIFASGGALLFVSCGALFLVRPALKKQPAPPKKKPVRRGRSTRTKALYINTQLRPGGGFSGNVTEDEV